MNVAADRLEFAPPPTRGLLRALGLAVLAHMVLVAALTWGVQWKRDAEIVSAEAELWSSIPQQAAPKLVEPPPAPPPPKIEPAPVPVTPKAPAPDIALEREKQRVAKEKQQAAQKQEQDKREQQKLVQEKKRQQDEKAALDKKKSAQEAKRQETLNAKQEAAREEARRKENVARSVGLAGSAGAPTSTGTALQSSGTSKGYASKLAAHIRDRILFSETPPGNPTAIFEIAVAADGTITSAKLLKSSGLPAWDKAVQLGIDRASVVPREEIKSAPQSFEIVFKRYE